MASGGDYSLAIMKQTLTVGARKFHQQFHELLKAVRLEDKSVVITYGHDGVPVAMLVPYKEEVMPSAGNPVVPEHGIRIAPAAAPPSKPKGGGRKISAAAAFECWWHHYPKKVARSKALTSWKKIPAKHRPTANAVIAFIEAAERTDRWRGGHIPDGSTFVNQRRWEDDLAAYGGIMPPANAEPPEIDIQERLERLAAAIPGEFMAIAEDVAALEGSCEEVERALERLDLIMLKTAWEALSKDDQGEILSGAELSPNLLERLDAAAAERGRKNVARQLTRKKAGLPFLSLFGAAAEGKDHA